MQSHNYCYEKIYHRYAAVSRSLLFHKNPHYFVLELYPFALENGFLPWPALFEYTKLYAKAEIVYCAVYRTP